MTETIAVPDAYEALRTVIVTQVTGNVSGLSADRADAIAEDVIAAMAVQRLSVRVTVPRGARGGKRSTRHGTTCAGTCERVMYTQMITKQDLPEGSVHHHSNGYCGTCNSRRVRELRKARIGS